METNKLTLAITADSLADSITVLRTGGIDNDTLQLRRLADRILETVRDSNSVELVLADSGKTVSYDDLVRAVHTGRSAAENSGAFFGSNDRQWVDRPVHLVAVCSQNARGFGIPWGCFPDAIDDLLTVAGLRERVTLYVEDTLPLEQFVAFISRHAHPFCEAVLVDQYLMAKPDDFLAAGLVPFINALTNQSRVIVPRITLIETIKRCDEETRNSTSEEIARQDLSRLRSLMPSVEWSVILVDLNAPALVQRGLLRDALSKSLHDRVLVTNSMMIKSGYGFAVVAGKQTPTRNRSRQPVLLKTSYDIDVVLDTAGRLALLGYTTEIGRQLKACLHTENAIITAGSLEANRLLGAVRQAAL